LFLSQLNTGLTRNFRSTSPFRGWPCASFKSAKDEILRGTRARVVCKGYEGGYLSSGRLKTQGGERSNIETGEEVGIQTPVSDSSTWIGGDVETLRRKRPRVSCGLGSMCQKGGFLFLYTVQDG